MAQDTEYRIANNIFLTMFDLCSTSVLLIEFQLHVMKITESLILKYRFLGLSTYLGRT